MASLTAVLAVLVARMFVVWPSHEVWTIVAALVAADVAAIGLPRVLARGVGGMTGDLFGATVVLVETCVLVVAALAV